MLECFTRVLAKYSLELAPQKSGWVEFDLASGRSREPLEVPSDSRLAHILLGSYEISGPLLQ